MGDGAPGVGGLACSLVWPLSKVSLTCSDKVLATTHLDPSFYTEGSESVILRWFLILRWNPGFLRSGRLHVWMHSRSSHC